MLSGRLIPEGCLPKQDIVTIGASAGGVEALKTIVAGLPAAILVVEHIGGGINGKSFLPEILTRAGPLPAANPRPGEKMRKGKIYVAPPDRHLLVEDGHLHVFRGPRENGTRPAINPLFRSAAAAYGNRVAGVILTGMLDDGVAGLAEIKRRGGVAVVQDPQTALYSSMPLNALEYVDVDHIAPLIEIAGLITTLATTEREPVEPRDEPVVRTPTNLTCPECRGPIHQEQQGRIIEYRCRVGHVYSPATIEQEQDATVERALWSAVLTLEEAADMAEKFGNELGEEAAEKVRRKRSDAAVLRQILEGSSSAKRK